jgi:hypothetical protein
MAAATATIALHPVDTAKTILQRGGSTRSLGRRGLYRGVLPAAFSVMPACAVRMGSYEVLKASLLLNAPAAVAPNLLVFCASAASVVVSAAVRAPLDMIKTQVQADASVTAVHSLRAAWGRGGAPALSRLYRGVGLALVRDVPFFGLNLLFYERLKAIATTNHLERIGSTVGGGSQPHQQAVELPSVELVTIGAVSQGLAGFLTNPVDVLKTRVQTGAATGVAAALASVRRAGGPGGLMRGAGMRVVWVAPQGCVYYPTYEAVQRLLAGAPRDGRE